MEKRIDIVFVTERYWPSVGGIEQTVHSLCCRLPHPFQTEIITLNPSTDHRSLLQYYLTEKGPRQNPMGHTIRYLEASTLQKVVLLPLLLWNTQGIRHYRSPVMYDRLYFWFRMAFKRNLKKLLCHRHIVHCFSTSYVARLATEICNENSIPLIHTPPIHFGRWGDSPQQCNAYMKGTAITCFTEHFKKQLTTLCETNNDSSIHVIPPFNSCGMNGDSFGEYPVEDRYILFLGRREPHKGLQLLIDSYKLLNTNVKLVIAGPGPVLHATNAMTIDLGEVSETTKHSLLSRCECLAVPTRDESFGIVFTEAMSYGKPVIAIDVPPINEIVENGITGLLIQVPGNPKDLSRALQTILDDSDLRINMGAKAKKRYDRLYRPQVVLSKILSLYEQCLQK